ncbi:MAG: SulP family inorganic anion transporter, partial [Nitrospirae bacterium]|nr:SulP family inorganic anion transporter [Nitrospirota bacterium]
MELLTQRLFPSLPFLRSYSPSSLRLDLVAGLTVALMALPQAMAYALIAGLDPKYGLYACIVPAVLGALFGSSAHLVTGCTNAISLVVLSTMGRFQGSGDFMGLIFLLALLVGVIQIVFGLARMGNLINFVSHSVLIGFTAGAGVLIAVNQLKNLFGVSIPQTHHFWEVILHTVEKLPDTHWPTLGLGLFTIAVVLGVQKISAKLPGPLIAMVVSGGAVYALGLGEHGVRAVGEIPQSLPPVQLPLMEMGAIRQLAPGALAIAILGVVEALSISKAIATQTKQKIDGNQEFIGQGLSNLGAAFFSGYPGSGSFTKSAVNFRAGARTPMAAAYSGGFILLMLLVFAPWARYIPIASLAGILLIVAYNMVDKDHLKLAFQATRTDQRVLVFTFLATLFLELEFAVFVGVFISILLFVRKVSTPEVEHLIPRRSHLKVRAVRPGEATCPQVSIFQVKGGFFFGAVSSIEEALEQANEGKHTQIFVLRMKSVPMIDATGIMLLESLLEHHRGYGGVMYL